jgi:hypothetical protein
MRNSFKFLVDVITDIRYYEIKEVDNMNKMRKVIYTVSGDLEFGSVEDEVIILAPNIVAEKYDDTEVVFYITDTTQEVINIDRATCPRFLIDFDKQVDEINFEQLSQITFLDLIRAYAK